MQLTRIGQLLAARGEWRYGLKLDAMSRIPFTKLGNGRKGTIRETLRSVEGLSCINRLTGYLDHDGCRYFINPEMKLLRAGTDFILRGIN